MNQDVATLISRLETRTRELMQHYDKVCLQLRDTEQKLEEQKLQCLILEEEKQTLEDKYARLKMARLIDMADDDELRSTRKRINKMIASVDKCLATLKVEQ